MLPQLSILSVAIPVRKALPEAQRTQGIASTCITCDKNQFEGGMTCISSNFGHQRALNVLVVD